MTLNEKSSCVRYPSGRLKAGGAPKPPSDYISTEIPPSRFEILGLPCTTVYCCVLMYLIRECFEKYRCVPKIASPEA